MEADVGSHAQKSHHAHAGVAGEGHTLEAKPHVHEVPHSGPANPARSHSERPRLGQAWLRAVLPSAGQNGPAAQGREV